MNEEKIPDFAQPLIEELFLEQVARCPDAIALVDGTRRLTYGQLHRKASRVAAGLVARGVVRESIVAMAFERSADAVVCTLAIVLAGGAYLPVNPDFARERRAHMIADSGARLVVCGNGIAASMGSELPAGVLAVDFAELAETSSSPGVPVAPRPGDRSPLAYLMYTSGSTGRPKGVLVEQAGIVRLVKDSDFFRFSGDERLLATGALEFDAATFEIWGCLLNGASLHMTDKETLLVPALLRQALRDHEITVMWLTAPLFAQLADIDVEVFAPLRTLLVGGDVVSPRHVALVHAAHPRLRVINGYGPTENTTFTTTFEVLPGEYDDIPIGVPVNGTSVLVVGEQGVVAPGEQGELYTGGRGLARGYLNNPELTAAAFVFVDGERYYRTGDRVSLDANGLLRFHGRIDDQVKIRGHRVEVKEAEAALLACAGVRDGCVVVAGDAAGRHLLAYVVLAPGVEIDAVNAALADRVPEYLRPDRILALDRLPLNANGKVDKGALASRVADAPAELTDLPAGQRKLATVWAEVLRVDVRTIGAEDDFFALGGNSLAVGALLGRLAVRHDIRLSFKEVFTHRTLRSMTEAVERADPAHSAPITSVAQDVPVEVHPQQRGIHTSWQIDAASLAYNVPTRIDLTGAVTAGQVRAAIDALVDRHDALRTRFTTTAAGVRQVVEPSVPTHFVESTPHEHPTDEEVVRTFVRPFDLSRAPLLRAMLVRDDELRHRLYLDVHHVVFDGVSLRILVGELADLLAGIPLAPPKWGYADASQWFADRTADQPYRADERYWLRTLADPPRLDLPTDHPRPEVRTSGGAVVRRYCTPGQSAAVARIATRMGTTDFVVLLSAYTAVLMRLSGQRDVVVGSPMSGRVHPDFDAVVGMFVNTAALRVGIEEPASLAELASEVHRIHQESLEHQTYPFDSVLSGLNLPRDPARLPLLDAFFALQNIGFYEFDRAGLRVTVDLLHPGSCRFDLNLQAHQRPEGLVLELEHNTGLFTTSSAEYLLNRVVELLDELDGSPHHSVFDQPASLDAVTTAAHADFSF